MLWLFQLLILTNGLASESAVGLLSKPFQQSKQILTINLKFPKFFLLMAYHSLDLLHQFTAYSTQQVPLRFIVSFSHLIKSVLYIYFYHPSKRIFLVFGQIITSIAIAEETSPQVSCIQFLSSYLKRNLSLC